MICSTLNLLYKTYMNSRFFYYFCLLFLSAASMFSPATHSYIALILCTSFRTINTCVHISLYISAIYLYINMCMCVACKWNSCISFFYLFHLILFTFDSLCSNFRASFLCSSGRFRLSKVRHVLSNFFRSFFDF